MIDESSILDWIWHSSLESPLRRQESVFLTETLNSMLLVSDAAFLQFRSNMNFDNYEKRVRQVGEAESKSEEQIQILLAYARPLIQQGLPVITSREHFAQLVGYTPDYIYRMSRYSSGFYREFTVPKKSGGRRIINEPLPDLKTVQSWILHNILVKYRCSKYAKAYLPKKSIRDNARFHCRQKYIVNLDIVDFFPSTKKRTVYKTLAHRGYTKGITLLLTNLCTLRGALPQGAPTSPYLSNLCFLDLDEQISDYCKKNSWMYTRYADDMSFSGSGNIHSLIKTVSCLVYQQGYKLNSKKTRVSGRGARQQVTGVVVNEKMQVTRSVRRRIRQEMHYITTYGLNSHLEHQQITNKYYVSRLLGKIQYCLFINPKDEEMERYRDILNSKS